MARNSKAFGRIYNELDRIAAITRPLTPEELQQLDELVVVTRMLAAEDSSTMVRRLHRRAKLMRKSKTPRRKHSQTQRAGLRRVPDDLAGPGEIEPRSQVLGGLQSSRWGS
ncbi:hypothetical protein [Mycobacteroides chelonae]|uniref:hypothetical protein n=1 Tax=Mycobacteroides chelonae TaxID=1774 RepID=UPI0018B05007|nr:hypothetical protein [Mycobacteroides chelonae]MBF9519559.1 hypothetical protein [Mycobacteroides chelonae]